MADQLLRTIRQFSKAQRRRICAKDGISVFEESVSENPSIRTGWTEVQFEDRSKAKAGTVGERSEVYIFWTDGPFFPTERDANLNSGIAREPVLASVVTGEFLGAGNLFIDRRDWSAGAADERRTSVDYGDISRWQVDALSVDSDRHEVKGPVSQRSTDGNEWEELDVAFKQSFILTTEGEEATE